MSVLWLVLVSHLSDDNESIQVREALKFRSDLTVVSLIAGVGADLLKEKCAPATAIFQAVPLPPAEKQKSTTVACLWIDDGVKMLHGT